MSKQLSAYEVQLEANKAQLTTELQQGNVKATKDIWLKLNNIEDKSECKSVKFIDRIADAILSFGKWQIKLSGKVRTLTTKINAPYSNRVNIKK
jgi:hypothetical protein